MRVYTDGSCRMGIGGWAWWNQDTGESESGVESPSTNQRMELYAALDAIDTYLDDRYLVIISDSAYLVNCFIDGWWVKWRANGWRNRDGKPIENQDIWEPLINLVEHHGTVQFEKVKGHSGVPGNERADALAARVVELAMGDG